MAYEDLIKSMESAANEKNTEIIRNTDLEVDAILRNAENESSAIHSNHIEKARRTLTMESNRRIFRAHQDVKSEVSQIREDLINKAFEEAKNELENVRKRSDYMTLYSDLIQDVIAALPDEEVTIHVDPADGEICRKILCNLELSCQVEEDISTPFGLDAACPDGRLVASNTLDKRIIAIREACIMEITTLLLGDSNG